MSNENEAENSIAKELVANITSVSNITCGNLTNQSIKSATHNVKCYRQKKNTCSTRISRNLQTSSSKSYSNIVFETFENTTPNRIKNLQTSCNISDGDNVNEPAEDVVDLTNANIQNNFPSYKISR